MEWRRDKRKQSIKIDRIDRFTDDEITIIDIHFLINTWIKTNIIVDKIEIWNESFVHWMNFQSLWLIVIGGVKSNLYLL